MPPKARSKDKGKAPQTQPTKTESLKPSTKLMSSAILTAKPIKSQYEAVVEEEETTKQSQVQTDLVQHWVDTISKSPKLLLALQKVSQQTFSDSMSQTGSISNSISKPRRGISASKTLPLLFPKLFLQIGTTNLGIQPNHNFTMLLSLTSPTLSSSNTSNYISITLTRHILHASFTKLSILKIGDNPYINLSHSPHTFIHISKISIPPICIGITNKHGSMPSSYKIKTITILGFSTSIMA